MPNTQRTAKRRHRKPGVAISDTGREATLGQFLRYLSSNFIDKAYEPVWPPDVFAVAASVLEKSGAYIELVSNWPPGPQPKGNKMQAWVKANRKVAKKWRDAAVRSRRPPREVIRWWKHLLDQRHGSSPGNS